MGAIASVVAVTFLSILACQITSGCGASYQAIYEGEVRFEHCYRLDEQPTVPLTQRRECWKEWTQFYTYGQTRDRLEYALMRQRVLSQQIENPTGLLADPDAGTHPSATLAAPAPTSPFEPPPTLAATTPADAGNEAAAEDATMKATAMALTDPANAPAAQKCLLGCVDAWRTCTAACEPAKLGPCKNLCDVKFRTCARRCL